MDSLDSDTFYLISLFQQGSYRAAISAYLNLSATSPTLTLYAARSHLALIPPATNAALSLLSTLPASLDQRAITAFAHYLSGSTEEALSELDEILMELGDGGLEGSEEGRTVRGVTGSVYFLEGEERREEGVEILREAIELGSDQECLGVLSHLYLALGRPSQSNALLTSPTVQSFTADSLLSQLLTAQTNLASGPTAKYQEAYYVYEEIKGMQGGRSEGTLTGVGVSQALLGRWEEASQATGEALELNPTHSTTLANSIALGLHAGKPAAAIDEALQKLESLDPSHPLLLALEEKSNLFDSAAAKFGIEV